MTKPKIENIPIEHDSFLNEIPDFDGFIHANDDLLNFPLSISQLAKARNVNVLCGKASFTNNSEIIVETSEKKEKIQLRYSYF